MFKIGFEAVKGGLADGIPDDAYKSKDVKKGMKVEKEHSKSKKVQKEIAKDHLTEDPKYYDKLEKIEKKAGVSDKVKMLVAAIKSNIDARDTEKGISEFKKLREAGKRIKSDIEIKRVGNK